VRKMEVVGVRVEMPTNQPIVLLKEVQGERYLPIWIGPVEATAIPDVLFERGMYWASGRSGVVNLVAAHKWFNLAAVRGNADATRLRREIADQMSEIEIAAAQRAARDWLRAH